MLLNSLPFHQTLTGLPKHVKQDLESKPGRDGKSYQLVTNTIMSLCRKVSKATAPRKQQSSDSTDKMSHVLANPKSSSSPKSNYPLKVDTSKLISLSAKISDIIDTLNKCHTDLRFINNDYLTFLFVTLNVQDIHYLFSKIIFLHIFGYFLKWPCGVHVLAIRYILTTPLPRKQRQKKGAKSKRKEGSYFRNFLCLPVICKTNLNSIATVIIIVSFILQLLL